jgi:hypothetical protein
VYGEIKPHQFDESLVVTKTQEGGQIIGIIFVGVDSRKLALTEYVAVDSASDVWKLCDPKLV